MNSNTLPTAPVAAYMNLPATEAVDVETGSRKHVKTQKLPLSSSWANVRLEWKHGSKMRVLKYCGISIAFGIVTAGAIGFVIVMV